MTLFYASHHDADDDQENDSWRRFSVSLYVHVNAK